MKVGMLWFDNNDQRDLEAKLRRAISHYEVKHGRRPTVCYVHPSMMLGQRRSVEGLDLRTTNTVLPHHFWLGEGEESRHEPAA